MDRAKPYSIPKREVWEAYKRVRANQGVAGVDGQTIADFEADLANNLYKLWNRLTSGSYFPPPVRRVDIPKSDGKHRADGGQTPPGTYGGTQISPGFLWIPARQIGARCDRRGAAAMLASRLGS